MVERELNVHESELGAEGIRNFPHGEEVRGNIETVQNINDVSQYDVVGESLKKGNISRGVAEAIINGSGEIKANDTNRRFNSMDYDFFAEYLTESAENDGAITGTLIENILHKFVEQTEVNNLKQFVEKNGGFSAFDLSREEKKKQ